MVSTYQKFIRLLQLEIESMHDEIEILLTSLDRRLADHEITDYVRNENAAVLRNELLGLEDCLRTTFDTEGREDATVDEIASEVRACIRQRIEARGYVPALGELIDRRIEKIAAYFRSPVASR